MLSQYQLPANTAKRPENLALDKTFAQMTDIFFTLPIKPAHFIYIISDIGNDGVGDLIHLIRAYTILNQVFPGHIKCIAFVFKSSLDKYLKIALDFQIPIEFRDVLLQTHPDNALIEPDTLDLVIHISLVVMKPRILAHHVRHYRLLEIQYHGDTVDDRTNIGYIGFLHENEGMWIDPIPYGNNKAAVLFRAPLSVKYLLGVFQFTNETHAKNWLEKTWIADSYYFEKKYFFLMLIAQLQFIKNKSRDIHYVVIKYKNFSREKSSWNLSDLLSDNAIKTELCNLNVNCIIIDSSIMRLSNNNRIILRLVSAHLPQTDYPIFQQLINGISLPAGDNTYCESWSNKNTMFPPMPELRDYKQASLMLLEDVITSLNVSERNKNWLRDLMIFNQRMNLYANHREIPWLIKEGKDLGDHWANIDSPHDTWVAFSSALEKHNLNNRFVSIVKEQLMFSTHPDLIRVKNDCLNLNGDSALAMYRQTVSSALCSSQKAGLKQQAK